MKPETTTPNPETSVAVKQPRTVKDFLALPAYKSRFEEVLGKRANQFAASVVAVSQSPALADADPVSVITSAMVSATLDLPVNPTLGFAYIIAYKDCAKKVAQFQIGYKGIIQLALRSGQYRRMNAGPINAEVFAGYDQVGEPILDWSKFDAMKEAAGYFAAWELTNGYVKVVYWPRGQVEAHAKRFSKAMNNARSPWTTDFDAMATKTVLKNGLSKWGILSVELQKAIEHDQGAQTEIDGPVKYPDHDTITVEEVKKPIFRKKSDAVAQANDDATLDPGPAGSASAKEPATDLPDKQTIIDILEGRLLDAGKTEQDAITVAVGLGHAPVKKLSDLPVEVLDKVNDYFRAKK